jgi:anti-anti-sigma factor
MHFKVSTSPIEHDGLIISVEGELDLFTAERVRRAVGPAIVARRPLLLDLSRCPFIDSTGLHLVLEIHGGFTNGEGSGPPMAVVASPPLRRFFSLTAIDLSVPVFLNRRQALESLAASRSQINASST